jgi:hypothetical protein
MHVGARARRLSMADAEDGSHAMPRYFFEVTNRNGVMRDSEGQVFQDREGARRQAIETVRSIVSDEVKRGFIDLRGRIQVSSSAGKVLTLPFTEAVEVHVGMPPDSTERPGIDHD